MIIRVEHLRKEYPAATPLRDVTFDVERGEAISVIGPSGTGKSTLLRCMNRLEDPTSGTVSFLGQDLGDRSCDLSRVRQKMGMVFQSFNLYHHMNVVENVAYAPAKVLGLSRSDAYERAMRLLRAVGLADKELARVDELSGGQKQRVAIARTLAMDCEIILFDEPTSALDPTMVGEVVSVIRRLSQDEMTMLIVTHEMQLARTVSSRILYLDQGVVYEDGTPERVFGNPRRELTRRFVNGLDSLERSFTRDAFDYLGFLSDVNAFAVRKMLPPSLVNNIQMAVEEIYLQTILPLLGADAHASIRLDYAERNGSCDIAFAWEGEAADPLPGMDELSRSLSDFATTDLRYDRTDDGRNRIEAQVRP